MPTLRAAVLPRLRKAVPVDARWWASADPSTLLFTRSYREELPEDSGPYFVANEFLLEDLGGHADGSNLPIEISALAVKLRHLPATGPALPRLRVRVRTTSGRWAVLHASWMNSQAGQAITVILQEAVPAEVAPLTADTVQDHLKSVFERTGVHSRGQLVAAIFERDYLPPSIAGDPVSPSGAFAAG